MANHKCVKLVVGGKALLVSSFLFHFHFLHCGNFFPSSSSSLIDCPRPIKFQVQVHDILLAALLISYLSFFTFFPHAGLLKYCSFSLLLLISACVIAIVDPLERIIENVSRLVLKYFIANYLIEFAKLFLVSFNLNYFSKNNNGYFNYVKSVK